MPDNIFRLVVTAAVVLAAIAFVVQAVVVVAFYRIVRKVQEKVDDLATGVAPLMEKIGPVVEKLGPVIDQAAPVFERLGPVMDGAADTLERLRPVIDRTVEIAGKIGVMVEQAGPVLDGARQVLASANQIVVDARPRITEFSGEALAAARSGREQVERIGDLLHDASGRARARLEQIDQSVGHTVEQVGNAGDAMKRAVMRPVREANGLAAGISAAVSTLVHPRKAPPDAATQDEEMFI